MNTNVILSCRDLHKSYQDGQSTIPILQGVEFDLHPGEKVAIIGKSGAGKTTLVNHLGGLERPTKGHVYYEGTDIHTLSDKRRGHLRNRLFGFVFQFHHLLAEFNALENVCMPLLLRDTPIATAKEMAFEALKQVELEHRVSHKPSKLSGGERQRVAIARALVTQPKCVLADEPTGNLDQDSAQHVYDLMMNLAQKVGTSFIVVTHDLDLAKRMDRVVLLEKGLLHHYCPQSEQIIERRSS